MNELQTLTAAGLALPTPSYLFGLVFFGIAGYAAFRYGRNTGLAKPKWIGITMMLYPYLVSETWLLYCIGLGLCALIYFYRD
jgi:hypothetical protein